MVQDAKDKGSDALPEGGQPLVPGDRKPSEEVVLFTKEEHEGEMARRHSTLDKKIAELEKSAVERDELRAEKETRQRQDDEAEQKRATEEGPEALDILSRRRTAREEAAKSAKLKAEAEGKIAEAADIVQWRLDKTIAEVAKETGVSEEDIRLLGPITLEEVKKAADLVAKLKVVPAGATKPPDPGITSGGVSWRDKSPEEKILHAIEHPKK